MQSPYNKAGIREVIWKELGETPLQALERFRAAEVAHGRTELAEAPMTYAGRLDPMAEGELLVLIGDECKKKDEYLGLDKEYEIEVVFGIQTDTFDALGLARPSEEVPDTKDILSRIGAEVATRVGTFTQEYPAYSSRTVQGKQLHELARAGELPDELPTRQVTINAIQIIEKNEISWADLRARINENILKVTGDFRQNIILNRWNGLFIGRDDMLLPIVRMNVRCSAGTYMRSLAYELGRALGTHAFAFSIKRTAISFTRQTNCSTEIDT
jgi:tRNA pseudouridine55 synthase